MSEMQDYKSRVSDPSSRKFETFSYLPAMNADQIKKQVEYIVGTGYGRYRVTFHATGLHDFLSAKTVDSVVIAGLTFPNCVLAAQLNATDRDYRVGLAPSACTQVEDAGLVAMQRKGVQLMTLDELRGLLL